MSTKFKIIMPTADEDAAITAAALSDPDAQPLTDSELAQFTPTRSRGRPPQSVTKIPTSLRLDPEVLDAFKQTGPGWQTRINEALTEYARAREMSPGPAALARSKDSIDRSQEAKQQQVSPVTQAIAELKESLCTRVAAGELFARSSVVHKWSAPWRALVLREALAWRVQDLLQQSCALHEQQGILGARILLRSALETVAVLIFLNQAIRSVVSGQADFHQFSDATTKLLLGSRDKSTKYDSINILTVLREADTRYPGLAELYAGLSESAHPNHEGVILGYSEKCLESSSTIFTNKWAEMYGEGYADTLMLCLETFRHEYNDEFAAAFEELEQWILENDVSLKSTKPRRP